MSLSNPDATLQKPDSCPRLELIYVTGPYKMRKKSAPAPTHQSSAVVGSRPTIPGHNRHRERKVRELLSTWLAAALRSGFSV